MKEYRLDNTNSNKNSVESRVLLDSTLFQPNSTVEGLAFLKSFEQSKTRTDKDYVRIFFKDKCYRTFQGNIPIVDTRVLTTLDLDNSVGKVALIKGVVSPFLNMNIVNIISLDIIEKTELKESDFMKKVRNLDSIEESLNDIIEQCKNENTADIIESIDRVNLKRLLKNNFIAGDFTVVGSPMFIAKEIADTYMKINKSFEGITGIEFKILFSVIAIGLLSTLETGKQLKPRLVETRETENYLKLKDIISKYNMFGMVYKSVGNTEFDHLYECIYFGKTPETLCAKIFIDTFNRCKELIKYAMMESSTFDDNRNNFNGEIHVKLGGER